MKYPNWFSSIYLLISFCICFCANTHAQEGARSKTKKKQRAEDFTRKTDNGIWPDTFGNRGSSLGYLELNVIETDPSMKVAKETVPFDKLFFLKIKRAGQSPKKIKSIKVDSSLTRMIPEGELTTTFSHDSSAVLKEAVNPAPVRVVLTNGLKKKPSNISLDMIYEDPKSSEYILVELQRLRPGREYNLEIKWDNGKVTDYYMTTVSNSFERRAKQRLTPAIGLSSAYFGAVGSDKTFVKQSLLVGFYYHYRPIDKEIPTRAYRLLSLQRLSSFIALSVTSLEEEFVRKDLIGDSNLFVGLGYSLLDGLSVNSGLMLFQEVNPNRLFSDRTSIKGTYYWGATIDLRIQNLIGGFITTLGFK